MHKLEKKVILIDVDGTLVDYENHLPPSAVKAIRMARAQGHLVYICTGRSRSEVYDEIWNIRLDGMIGANGGYIEHHGEEQRESRYQRSPCAPYPGKGVQAVCVHHQRDWAARHCGRTLVRRAPEAQGSDGVHGAEHRTAPGSPLRRFRGKAYPGIRQPVAKPDGLL